jgi:hypothetical protein
MLAPLQLPAVPLAISSSRILCCLIQTETLPDFTDWRRLLGRRPRCRPADSNARAALRDKFETQGHRLDAAMPPAAQQRHVGTDRDLHRQRAGGSENDVQFGIGQLQRRHKPSQEQESNEGAHVETPSVPCGFSFGRTPHLPQRQAARIIWPQP